MMIQHEESVSMIILAAGKGTRMKSEIAKVLHPICGKPMIHYVVATALAIPNAHVIVVVGHQGDDVKKTVLEISGNVHFVFQNEQKGTGHAVMCAMPAVPLECGHVIILSGDVPLISAQTIQALRNCHLHHANDITVLAVFLDNPFGYGRIIQTRTGEVQRIVEESDASADEKQIKIINSGIYCVKRSFLEKSLIQITPDNAQKEIYLTDIIGIAAQHQKKIGLMLGSNPNEILGVNSMRDLQKVESLAREMNR